MAITLSDKGRDAACNALTALLNPGGSLKLYSANGKKVAEMKLSKEAFAPAQQGVAYANPIAPDKKAIGGALTGGYHTFENQDGVEIWRGSIGTSAADVVLSSMNVGAGDTVAVAKYMVKVPSS